MREFKDIYKAILDNNDTDLENRFNLEIDRQMRALTDPELWEIYSSAYSSAKITFLDSDDDICKTFEGLNASDLICLIRDYDLDFTKYFLIENPDVSGYYGDGSCWTVDSVVDIMPDDDTPLEWVLEHEDFGWFDENTDEMRAIAEEAEKYFENDTTERLRAKVEELLIEMQSERGITDGCTFPEIEFKFDERLESLAEIVDAIVDIQRMFKEDKEARND